MIVKKLRVRKLLRNMKKEERKKKQYPIIIRLVIVRIVFILKILLKFEELYDHSLPPFTTIFFFFFGNQSGKPKTIRK